MPRPLSLALAQLNPTVGDIGGNIAKLRTARAQAAEQGVDILVTSELYISAYSPEDLVLKHSFQHAVRNAIQILARETADGGPAMLVGSPWRKDGKLYNAALLLDGGQIVAEILKHDLPNYGPFDEKRIFVAGPLPEPVLFRGIKLGVMICEDMWTPTPAAHLREQGAHLLVVLNGSPFEIRKPETRLRLARARVAETGMPLVYVNQWGGQDELVFDGGSFVLGADAACAAQAASFADDLVIVRYARGNLSRQTPTHATAHDDLSLIYLALQTGLRDYVDKNGFPGVLLGLSGGIDSALAVAIAVDALGADRVWCVMLPSPYTSQDSLDDAASVAGTFDCRYEVISISDAMRVFDAALSGLVTEHAAGVTFENIQSRCRGIILMALSNAFGSMVLSTGNKSEMSVGYTTLYGDLCGGFAVLKDVYKTEVYRLAHWRNAHAPEGGKGPEGVVISERILTKAPTAELRPNQTDQDSLPPYDILDGILKGLIEDDLGVQETARRGFDAATVARVWGMLDKAEYKRRQAPPGVKITRRNLGRDRRYPITNKYRERAGG